MMKAAALALFVVLLAGCTQPSPGATLSDTCYALYKGPLPRVQNIILRLTDDPTGSTITAGEVAETIGDLTAIYDESPPQMLALIDPQIDTMEDVLELLESGENRVIELVDLRTSSIDIVAVCDPIIDGAQNSPS